MFSKGQSVHIICSWNYQAQIAVRRAVVVSCGEKCMVLADAATGKAIGTHFRPQQQQDQYRRVFAGLTDKQAECIAEAMCDEVRLAEIERCERSMVSYLSRFKSADDGYVLAMHKKVQSLQADEALVHWR